MQVLWEEMTEPELVRVRSGDCAFVADARHFPVLVITWWGAADEALIRRYFEWSDAMLARAAAEDTKLAFISDNRASKRPPAHVRALTAELTDQTGDELSNRSVTTIIVLDSALVRGALTAIQWLSARPWDLTMCGDIETALSKALQLLEAADVPPPPRLDPARYTTPQMPTVDGESSAATG